MLEGRPPFRGASEYLTFQKVLHREFEYSEASAVDGVSKDLIGNLLQLDPTLRLGTKEQGGYSALKSHPFFEDIDWTRCLWEHDPPEVPKLPTQEELSSEEDESECSDSGEDESEEDELDENWKIAHLGGASLQKR
jgi:3-phosphoinositide dependent protein kinase-1